MCKSNLGPFPLHLGPIPHYEYCIGTYSTVSIFHLGPIPQSQNSFWDLFHSLIFFSKTMSRIGPNWGWNRSQSFWDHFHPQLGPIPPSNCVGLIPPSTKSGTYSTVSIGTLSTFNFGTYSTEKIGTYSILP